MTDAEREERIRNIEDRLGGAVIGRAAANAHREQGLAYKLAAELVHLEERSAAQLARRLEGLDLSPLRENAPLAGELERVLAVARALLDWAHGRDERL